MLKKLEEIKRLQDELEADYGVLSVSRFGNVLIYDWNNFVRMAEDNRITIRKRDSLAFPIELRFEEKGFEFVCNLSDKSYKEYKKSRAENTTSDGL